MVITNWTFEQQVYLFKVGYYNLIRLPDPKTGSLIRFTPKQIRAIELLRSGVLNVGYGGAARGGKTMLLVAFHLLMSYAYPGIRTVIGRKVVKNLKQTTIKTFIQLCLKCGITKVDKVAKLTGFDYYKNDVSQELKFGNGSEVLFIATALTPSDITEDLARFGSLEITFASVDESNETAIEVIETIGTRVGNWLNDKYKIQGNVFEVFNPSQGHVKRRFWNPFKNKEETETKKFVQALPTDNPSAEVREYVRVQTIKHEQGELSNTQFERLINGNFDYDDDPTKIFDDEAVDDLFTNSVIRSFADYTTPHLVADVAFMGSDKFVCSVWFGNVLKKWFVINQSTGNEVKDKMLEIANRYDIPMHQVFFDASGTGQGLTGTFPKRCEFIGSQRAVETDLYANRRSEFYYKAAAAVNNYEWFIEDKTYADQVKNELRSIKDAKPDTDGKRSIIAKERMKQALGCSPDFADNLQMKAYANYILTKKKIYFNP